MAIDISKLFMNGLNKEINTFAKSDDNVRESLIQGGKLIGIDRELPRLNVTLNNKVKLFLSESRKKDILFPIDVLMANDLCMYLESLFYKTLDEPIENINQTMINYNRSTLLKRLFNYHKYYESLLKSVSQAMTDYSTLDNTMFYFDINRDGDRVLDFALDACKEDSKVLHKVIDCHESFHKKMDNPKMLEYIDIKRSQIK